MTKDINGIYVNTDFIESTNKVRSFYEHNPFPNYDDAEDKSKLIELTKNNIYIQEMLTDIGSDKDIIEIGSGTSQLSNLIASTSNNRVVAFDATYNSLMLGKEFAINNNIINCNFIHGDIANINKIFKNNSFDYVICSGVLHHTSQPYENFVKISKLLKNDGSIIIGLYNSYGRLYSKIVKFFYKIFGITVLNFFDPILKNQKKSKNQKISWIRDQYQHPLESCHTFDEVFSWFSKNNFSVYDTIPNISKNSLDISSSKLFFQRIILQFAMNFNQLGKDGGLYIVKGKKCQKE